MIPKIVKVAAGVTSRIVEPNIFTEADLDQIMNVPSYIYFEEHHSVESYNFDRMRAEDVFSGFRPFQEAPFFRNGVQCLNEEIKDEGLGFGLKRPNPQIGNFMRVSSLDGDSSEEEN